MNIFPRKPSGGKCRVVCLGFGDGDADTIRCNHYALVLPMAIIVAVNTCTTFNQSNRRYQHLEHDFKLIRGMKSILATGVDVMFLDYFFHQHCWYKEGHYGKYWLHENMHVEHALLRSHVHTVILPIDKPPDRSQIPFLLQSLNDNRDRMERKGIKITCLSRSEAKKHLFFLQSDIQVSGLLPLGTYTLSDVQSLYVMHKKKHFMFRESKYGVSTGTVYQ